MHRSLHASSGRQLEQHCIIHMQHHTSSHITYQTLQFNFNSEALFQGGLYCAAAYNIKERDPMIRGSFMRKHLMMVERKNSLLTRGDLQENQAQKLLFI